MGGDIREGSDGRGHQGGVRWAGQHQGGVRWAGNIREGQMKGSRWAGQCKRGWTGNIR